MENWTEIKAWRRTRRAELIAARTAFASDQRRVWSERITGMLEAGFTLPSHMVIGFCWPYKGEFDTRFAVRHWRGRGSVAALPEVIEKSRPLRFRKWWPGAPMTPGVFGIPVPVGTEVLLPDVALVPMNGFDEQGYRLGYGGGYFDRTLAALERRVLSIGISFEALRVPTIHPQPHDIPMDFVVTEAGIYRAGGRALAPLGAAESAAEARSLLETHGLPRGHQAPLPAAAGTEPARSYASPPCYAGEICAEYFGATPGMSREELLDLLNTLLEAERAGAKVLAGFLSDYERDTPAWRRLAAVQRDEAKNCATLIDLIRRMNGTPSAATGNFLGKALAVAGRIERLQFLNRGQRWVVRRIDDALPRVEQAFVRDSLSAMRDSHLHNIEFCDALAGV